MKQVVAPMITVTFLPAKSESSPDTRAPTRAPMENIETIVPYNIYYFIWLNFTWCFMCTSNALVSTSSLDPHCIPSLSVWLNTSKSSSWSWLNEMLNVIRNPRISFTPLMDLTSYNIHTNFTSSLIQYSIVEYWYYIPWVVAPEKSSNTDEYCQQPYINPCHILVVSADQ